MYDSITPPWYCRVCGIEQEFAPWGEDGGPPTYFYCDCCGVEFGYGDGDPISVREHREKWLRGGAKWFDPKLKPEGWDLKEQLANIPELFE